MFWFILFGLMICAGIAICILSDWEGKTWGGFIIAFSLIAIAVIFGQWLENKNNVATYPQRKAFYESQTAGSEYEDATFKNRKAELNDGLFRAQWYRENMPLFSLYPEEVLELEPIK
jgi:hypothetical protein